MTLDQIVKADKADDIKKMSDEELLKAFERYLPVTRPEFGSLVANRQVQTYIPPQKVAAVRKCEELGIDMSFMKGKRRK